VPDVLDMAHTVLNLAHSTLGHKQFRLIYCSLLLLNLWGWVSIALSFLFFLSFLYFWGFYARIKGTTNWSTKESI